MESRKQRLVQYLPRLRRYARALLRDDDLAEDLVQDTMARALGKLHFWRPGSDMRAWLFTIMHNVFVNDRHRAVHNNTHALEDVAETNKASISSAEQDARFNDIEVALMKLPEGQRTVLLLITLEGLTYAETAKVLKIEKGTVMSRLHRARERMRQLMNEQTEPVVDRQIRRVK